MFNIPTSRQMDQPQKKQDNFCNERILAYFDMDCFYAQCEERSRPSYQGNPLAVTQKYIVVTCNYEARALGITKLMSVSEAIKRSKQKNCDLILVSGEDLTPYREASDEILATLQEAAHGSPVERGGLDEFVVDITVLAKNLSKEGDCLKEQLFADTCIVHRACCGTTTAAALVGGNNVVHRPQDVRACSEENPHPAGSNIIDDETKLLGAGTVVAQVLKNILRDTINITCSVGVSHNRLLAKLAAGLHKPNGLTALPKSEALLFLDPLPIRALDGVGNKIDKCIRGACGCNERGESTITCSELRSMLLNHSSLTGGSSFSFSSPMSHVSQAHHSSSNHNDDPLVLRCAHLLTKILSSIPQSKDVGIRLARALIKAECYRPVINSTGIPKSLSRENSFPSKCRFVELKDLITALSRDLAFAIVKDVETFGRRATKLNIRWREGVSRETGVAASTTILSSSCGNKRHGHTVSMPHAAYSFVHKQDRGDAVMDCGLAIESAVNEVIRQLLKEPFSMNLLNLGISSFNKIVSPRNSLHWKKTDVEVPSQELNLLSNRSAVRYLSKVEGRSVREGTYVCLLTQLSSSVSSSSSFLVPLAEIGTGSSLKRHKSDELLLNPWVCERCTLLNGASTPACLACGFICPDIEKIDEQVAIELQDAEQLSISIKRRGGGKRNKSDIRSHFTPLKSDVLES
jgi:nucleotidyltransferase/DNA polymerase involved in DNA repair